MNLTENQRFIIRLILFLALITGLILILPRLKSIITVIVISILMFTLLDSFVDKLERFKIPRALSALMVILIILLLIAFGISRVVPLVENAAKQISQSFNSENTFTEKLETGIVSLTNKLPFNTATIDIPERINGLINTLKKNLPTALIGFARGLISTFSSFFFVLFITFFFLKDERKIKKTLIRFVPNRYFEMSINLMDKIQRQLSAYLKGLFLAATNVGITSIIGLFLVNTFLDAGINYIILIGLWAGLANLIPYVGPTAGAIPAVISVLFTQPPNTFLVVLAVIAVFVLVQFIDNNFTSPYLVGKNVELHPLIVFLVLIIGGNLMGLLGMMLAVPIAGIIKVTVGEILTNAPKYRL
ncbi:MAG: AI-2E family transporter [Candidatus Marinimicrobia bacterium]|nr:AI-2E family transporter [Candidatus Neomarinimicrobiota bacterium]